MSHDERLVEAVARAIHEAEEKWTLEQTSDYIARAALDAINASGTHLLASWAEIERLVQAAAKDAGEEDGPLAYHGALGVLDFLRDACLAECPELRAAVRHVDAIANSSIRPTKEDCQMSHSLLVDLVLALHPPRVDLG